MNDKLQQRLKALQNEYEAGQKMLAELDAKRQNLTTTLLRIEGAMQVLQEMMQQEGGTSTAELKDRLADAIESLPERERLVIALYYYESLTLREIGEVLGVTESRVSQLHTKAVLALRSRFQATPL